MIWKSGRSAWLAWARLERLHRIVSEERWEIEHHRQQERSELKELYAAKGFEGQLLEDVLDVLMADGDRLLRVMVEEELGLSLEIYDHPLKQSLGAFVGALIASLGCLMINSLFPNFGLICSSLMIMGIAGALSAYYQKNRIIPAIVWNISLGALSLGTAYFLIEFSLSSG
jgi:VIT1/CCC1 family predicted Fe2+/Mn2+ transporter